MRFVVAIFNWIFARPSPYVADYNTLEFVLVFTIFSCFFIDDLV